MPLRLSWQPLPLPLRHTFRTAHGASETRHNVLVRVEEGVGEAACVPYHGETEETIAAALARAADLLGDDPEPIAEILSRVPQGSRAAQAGIDIALHDLVGQRLGQPLHQLLGLKPDPVPLTSFTIGLDLPQVMARRARESGMPILKIKLGGPDDERVMAAVRGATDARLRVDANGGWSRERAARLIPWLAELDVELVEQPLPVGDIDGLCDLRRQRPGVPIFADEGIRDPSDVAAYADAVDGVVVKLQKSGGLQGALRVITAARAAGLQVMIGCMIESSVGVTAAAHLASLCEHVDLDAPLLVAGDPYVGVRYQGARLVLPPGPGLGVRPRGAP